MTIIGEIELPLVPTLVPITQNFDLEIKPHLDQELEVTNHSTQLGLSKEIDEMTLEELYSLRSKKNELVFEEEKMKNQEPEENESESYVEHLMVLKYRILLVNLVEMIEDGISALEAKLFDADGCVGLINCVV
ncbi:hypothetical protein SLE2022_239930 [Rubroshorea leprosula]